MGRAAWAGIVILALLVAQAVSSINAQQTAGSTAKQYASSVFPNAHWTVVRQTFEPWSGDVRRANFRATGGIGPAWVVELSAPADQTWQRYQSVVVVSALTGMTESGAASGSSH